MKKINKSLILFLLSLLSSGSSMAYQNPVARKNLTSSSNDLQGSLDDLSLIASLSEKKTRVSTPVKKNDSNKVTVQKNDKVSKKDDSKKQNSSTNQVVTKLKKIPLKKTLGIGLPSVAAITLVTVGSIKWGPKLINKIGNTKKTQMPKNIIEENKKVVIDSSKNENKLKIENEPKIDKIDIPNKVTKIISLYGNDGEETQISESEWTFNNVTVQETKNSPIMQDVMTLIGNDNPNIKYWGKGWDTFLSICSSAPSHDFVNAYQSDRWTFWTDDIQLSLFKKNTNKESCLYGVVCTGGNDYSVFKLEKSNW